MAATVLIRRLTGAGPTSTDITAINTVANAQDVHEATATGSSNPIQIPSSGTNYSYWVNTQLDATVTPAGTINNLKWFTDGANGFGTGVDANVAEAQVYGQASGVLGVSGDQLTIANYGNGTTDLLTETANAFTFTSGSPKSITGTISNPTTGLFGNRAVYQLTVINTAGAGTTNQETFTWQFDET